MAQNIINGAPMTIFQGVNDASTRPLVIEPEAIPTHLPLVYGFAQWGPTDPQIVVGDSRVNIYGAQSFDERSEYATHATVLSNTINSAGNSQTFQRLRPTDAGPNASSRLWLDVLPTKIPGYERNTDGSIKVDANGQPVPTAVEIDGYKVMFVVTDCAPGEGGVDSFGQATIVAGTQTDVTAGTQSQRYPIMDVVTPHFGKKGNNHAWRLYAPTINSSTPIDTRVLQDAKAYPYRFACLVRTDETTTPRIVESLNGEQFVDATFKPGVINKATEMELFVGKRFPGEWNRLNDATYPNHWGPFSKAHVYNANIDTLLEMFYTAELPFFDQFSDFYTEDGEHHRFNFVSGVSSNNVPYHSFVVVRTGAEASLLTENSSLYARGGADGKMDEKILGELVAEEVLAFGNPDSHLQDMAKYPFSIMYDSGFPLATKYAMTNFIAVRKDTALVLSTHDTLGRSLTAAEESSLALSLKTRLQMFPESDYFGTAVMRGMVVGRSGTYINTKYPKRLPITIEIAYKAARYMGAGNGIWDQAQRFDNAPNSVIQLFNDINVTFTPATVRNKDWDNGLVWVQSYDTKRVFIPALKTIYDDDTSVLNSFFTMMACVDLQKVGYRAWLNMTGVSYLTKQQIVERNNNFIREAIEGKYDGRFTIVPTTYFTQNDLNRGYSYSTKITIGAAGLTTVQTLALEARRIEDMEAVA